MDGVALHGHDLLLVHVWVTRPTDRFLHEHGWVELPEQRLVIDFSNGHHAIMPTPIYYEAGEIERTTVYTVREARQMMVEHATYGPWPTDGENDD